MSTRIWTDADFLALVPEQQRMYMFLLSQPDLSHAGLVPLRLKRWASKSAGLTPDDVLRALKGLEATRFILVDEETEEVLIRTFVRNDDVYKQPKVMIRMGGDARQITSPELRAAFVAEMLRLPLHELEKETQRDVARQVVTALVAEFGEPAASGKPYREGYREGYPGDDGPDEDPEPPTTPPDHASPQVDTPAEGYREGYGEGFQEGYGIPPAYARAHSPIPQPPTTNPQTNTPSTPSDSALPLDGLLITPDGATVRDRRTLADHFDEFWAAYPRKVGKDDARKVWDRARVRASIEAVLQGAQRLAEDPNLPEKKYVPHPATWLARGGWDDEPLPPQGRAPSSVASGHNDHWSDPGAGFYSNGKEPT